MRAPKPWDASWNDRQDNQRPPQLITDRNPRPRLLSEALSRFFAQDHVIDAVGCKSFAVLSCTVGLSRSTFPKPVL